MYVVKIINDGVETEIHGNNESLASGNVVKGINSIDTCSFTLFPSNVGFDMLKEFQTLVKVYNTFRDRYEFHGRVLYSNPSMSESGLIQKSVTCESYFGYFCDSWQFYVPEKNWTVDGLLSHIIAVHNSQVETHKRFVMGKVTVTDPNDNLYLGIQRKNTWDTLKEKLLDKLGGEFQLRVEGGVNYIDYLVAVGETKTTEIAISHNMKSITKETDPSAYVTRLIPLGAKLKVDDGSDSEERVGIESVNGGLSYIDDERAIAEYGIHVGCVEWDDVTEPANLKSKAEKWLVENNKVKIKYTINALDLSTIGLDIDDFEVGNRHPVKNHLLGIDDVARISKKTINILDPVQSNIDIGENFKTLTDLQTEQASKTDQTLLGFANAFVPAQTYETDKKAMESELETKTNNTATETAKAISELRELIYPVGSIYLSTNATNPATIFGGEWTQIKDRFLLAAGDGYAAGSYGGEATHVLTESEMPSHWHSIYQQHSSGDNSLGLWDSYVKSSYQVFDQKYDSSQNIKAYAYGTKPTGGNAAHNNMPPYLAVYMWQRVS